jgi:hypothetical protein
MDTTFENLHQQCLLNFSLSGSHFFLPPSFLDTFDYHSTCVFCSASTRGRPGLPERAALVLAAADAPLLLAARLVSAPTAGPSHTHIDDIRFISISFIVFSIVIVIFIIFIIFSIFIIVVIIDCIALAAVASLAAAGTQLAFRHQIHLIIIFIILVETSLNIDCSVITD